MGLHQIAQVFFFGKSCEFRGLCIRQRITGRLVANHSKPRRRLGQANGGIITQTPCDGAGRALFQHRNRADIALKPWQGNARKPLPIADANIYIFACLYLINLRLKPYFMRLGWSGIGAQHSE